MCSVVVTLTSKVCCVSAPSRSAHTTRRRYDREPRGLIQAVHESGAHIKLSSVGRVLSSEQHVYPKLAR